nr:putative amidase [Quercus suber]
MGDPCGSSSGSAISVAANMAAVSLGTETDGSILCPSNNNLVVGIKPTVGLTSRAGVIPISPRQDSVGTVANVVYVIDALVGIDHYDNAAIETSWYIPKGGYAQAQFLKINGLHAKRVGIVRKPFYNFGIDIIATRTIEQHLKTLRTVANVVYVIDALVGIDHYDNAAIETSWYIPKGGYAQAQFLKINGLHAKRVGIVRKPFYNFGIDIIATRTIEQHLKTLR